MSIRTSKRVDMNVKELFHEIETAIRIENIALEHKFISQNEGAATNGRSFLLSS